jgi:hypothetical protein
VAALAGGTDEIVIDENRVLLFRKGQSKKLREIGVLLEK